MRYRLLGPLEIGDGDRPWRPGGRRERAALSLFLLRPNRPVGVEELIEAAWDAAPATARQQVHTLVHRLRSTVGPQVLRTEPPGYVFEVDPAEVDLDVFTALAAEARRAAADGRPDEAVALYRRATGLWRGPALADLDTRPLAAEAARLGELRLAVLAERFDAELTAGVDPVPELTALVAEHPYAERLRGQLMTALHQAGRTAEALARYREGHRQLVGDLGIEPGPGLREIHQEILRGPSGGQKTAEPADVGDPETGGWRPPCLLPPPLRLIVGRDDAIAWLRERVRERPSGDHDGTRIVAVHGAAGVGKSALVTAVAHRLRAEFPDGQLYARLGGTQPVRRGVAEAHASALIAFGVPASAIPPDPVDREALYRARLAGRRLLLVLDDAPDPETVRALAPGTGSAVLVTSRRRLFGLTEAEHLELGLLEPGTSRALLADIVGADRTDADPVATDEVIRYCGGLPLALCIAGARLASRTGLPVASYSRRLADDRRRLATLSTQDGGVEASILLSYQGLGEPARAALRRLASLTTAPFPAWMVAAVLDTGAADGEQVVDELVDAHLLQCQGEDAVGQARYHFHDLVRLVAVERGAVDDGQPVLRRAAARILSGWLSLVLVASEGFSGDRPARVWAGRTDEPDPVPRWVGLDTVLLHHLAWLDVEADMLAAAVQQAYDLGLDDLCWRLVWVLRSYLQLRGHRQMWQDIAGTGLAAAQRLGDRMAEGCMRLASAQRVTAEGGAIDDSDAIAADRIFADLGYPGGRAAAAFVRGEMAEFRNDGESACRHFGQALAYARDADDGCVAANAEAKLVGWQYKEDSPVATAVYARCKDRLRRLGALLDVAQVERRLGMWHERHGRGPEAAACYQRALRDAKILRDETGVAYLSLDEGRLRTVEGEHAAAADLFVEALTLFDRHGNEGGAARARYELGLLRLLQGRRDEARVLLTAAHERFVALGHARWSVRTETELARIYAAS
ncbi:AfsR/SARP family transcriptional regulator [Virgisporangium aurantiacum]|uniref:SARP family transcriptional regulator n=1 Tax=Virgisporangium aurantiacum TaxID=175570 RepID=A0A8J3ZK91_9ACTN|nr:AfsR/SARP family transcriptional regulator [Virgisporangium aurantiacum]GIJ64492.1 SARP family transcriptional regulator [Virgisporangium aurantiacum]